MKKKAVFFYMDAIFAITILMVGFMLISSTNRYKQDNIPLETVSEHAMNLLSTVKIKELCDVDCSCSVDVLEDQCSSIKNKDQTLINYFGEMYYREKNEKIEDLFTGLVEEGLYREDLYRVELRIENDPIFTQEGKTESSKLISSKRVVFGYYFDGITEKIEYWGPYILEVNLWQK